MANTEVKQPTTMSVPNKIPMKQAPKVQREETAKQAEAAEKIPGGKMVLGRKNFICMIIAGAMILIGFLLMLGGGSTPEQFNPDIFSTRRIVVGPTIAFLGFVFMGIAIIIKPKSEAQKASDAESTVE